MHGLAQPCADAMGADTAAASTHLRHHDGAQDALGKGLHIHVSLVRLHDLHSTQFGRRPQPRTSEASKTAAAERAATVRAPLAARSSLQRAARGAHAVRGSRLSTQLPARTTMLSPFLTLSPGAFSQLTILPASMPHRTDSSLAGMPRLNAAFALPASPTLAIM